jgi:hypothetical protein
MRQLQIVVFDELSNTKIHKTIKLPGLVIAANQRSMIGKKLFMIGGKTEFSTRKCRESHYCQSP